MTRPALHRRRPSGQSLVEFSLIITLVLTLFMAVFDLGRAIYGMSAVGNAARIGGRTAVVNQFKPDVRQRAADQATALGVDAAFVTCTGTLGEKVPEPASGVCVEFLEPDLGSDCSANLAVGCVAVVTAKWTFTPLTPFIGQITGSIPISSRTRIPIESICTTSGCPVP
jgi:Flp pilus assembly protein TadG